MVGYVLRDSQPAVTLQVFDRAAIRPGAFSCCGPLGDAEVGTMRVLEYTALAANLSKPDLAGWKLLQSDQTLPDITRIHYIYSSRVQLIQSYTVQSFAKHIVDVLPQTGILGEVHPEGDPLESP